MWDTTAADVAATVGGHGWVPVSLVAVLIMFFAVSLAYMVSYAFNLMDLKRWAKTELQQAVASTILIGLIFGVVMVEDEAGTTIAQSYGVQYMQALTERAAAGIVAPGLEGGKVSPFDVAYAQLRAMSDCTQKFYLDAYNTAENWEIFFTLGLRFGIDKYTIDIAEPIKFLMMLAMWQELNQAYYLANNLTWLALATYFQMNFLAWIETSAFTVFLPLGIVLRIFPFTRGAGAVLMAIAIGLYLVYPMMMVVMYTMVDTPKGCVLPEMKKEPEKICASDPAAFTHLQERLVREQKTKLGEGASETAKMIVYAYFFPLVNVIVTIGFIRTLASFLGADIAEIGRGIFKLI